MDNSSNIYSRNTTYFESRNLIEPGEQFVVADINIYNTSFCQIVDRFFKEFAQNVSVGMVKGIVGNRTNRTDEINYVSQNVPLMCLFGGMVYRVVSDFYSDDNSRIEYYVPSSGDYDACIGINDKMLYLESDVQNMFDFIEITKLFKYSVFDGTSIFINSEKFSTNRIDNHFSCSGKICSKIFMKKQMYSRLQLVFINLLKNLTELLISIGYKLTKSNPNVIDKIFYKFAEHRSKKGNLAIYIKAISFMDDYFDAHFRIAIPINGDKYYHLMEMTVLEKIMQRNLVLGHVINDTGMHKSFKIYHLTNSNYSIPIVSPQNILLMQTEDIMTRAKKDLPIHLAKCQKSYLRIRYLSNLLYNYQNLLPIEDRNIILAESNAVQEILLQNKSSVRKCTNIRNLPIYKKFDQDSINKTPIHYSIENIYDKKPSIADYTDLEIFSREPSAFDPMEHFHSTFIK